MKRDLKVPSWLLKLLRWLCPADLSETIEGDVIEQFHNDVTRVGESRARLRAFLNTLDFVRIGIISRHKRSHIVGPMLGHFFKFSLRGMKKNPGHSFTTIF